MKKKVDRIEILKLWEDYYGNDEDRQGAIKEMGYLSLFFILYILVMVIGIVWKFKH